MWGGWVSSNPPTGVNLPATTGTLWRWLKAVLEQMLKGMVASLATSGWAVVDDASTAVSVRPPELTDWAAKRPTLVFRSLLHLMLLLPLLYLPSSFVCTHHRLLLLWCVLHDEHYETALLFNRIIASSESSRSYNEIIGRENRLYYKAPILLTHWAKESVSATFVLLYDF